MEKRRKEGKTDYRARLGMLKSGKPRLVLRKTGRYLSASIIKFDIKGDKTLSSCNSKELEKYGWKASKKNTSAAYLTGLLLAKKAGSKDVILDMGLNKSTKGNKLYAMLKGASDGGIKVTINDLVPSDDRISGSHVASYAKSLEDTERSSKFSGYNKGGVDPSTMSDYFEAVKAKIGGGSAPKAESTTSEDVKEDVSESE